MREWARNNEGKIWAWLIGLGLVLLAVHNRYQSLTQYAFLPAVGLAVSCVAAFAVLAKRQRQITLGSKWLWVPMLLIVAGMGASGFVNGATLGERIAPLAMGLYLFGIYLVARVMGGELFRPFAFAVVVTAASCVAYGLIYPGMPTGGIVSPSSAEFCGNYDMAAGLMIFGVLVSPKKHQWWLAGVALVGVAFAGAAEAVFVVAVVAVYALLRRDWGRRVALPTGVICLGLVVGLGVGHLQPVFGRNLGRFAEPVVREREAMSEFGVRWERLGEAVSRVRPFGHGYKMTEFTRETVHNVPLVIVDQVGPLAGVAWLVATGYLLFRTKWKYAWLGVVAMGAFDHYVWTMVAPWYWALAGVSATVNHNDCIFRRA